MVWLELTSICLAMTSLTCPSLSLKLSAGTVDSTGRPENNYTLTSLKQNTVLWITNDLSYTTVFLTLERPGVCQWYVQYNTSSLCQGGERDHLHQHRGQVHHPVLLQLSYHWSSLLHHLPQVAGKWDNLSYVRDNVRSTGTRPLISGYPFCNPYVQHSDPFSWSNQIENIL